MIDLSLNEQRVIGCLIEKSKTTPEQYPLSINALTNACNQKSNRDPVMTLTEFEVQDVVDSLIEKRLILIQAGATSRVKKYQHRFCNTEFSDIQLSSQELAIICVLFLRGAQTPGELRTRTNRLCEFGNVLEVEAVLENMMMREREPYVRRLDKEPGKREARYQHCFGEANELLPPQSDNIADADARQEMVTAEHSQADRISALEEQVELMQLEIAELYEKLAQLNK